MFNKKDKQAIEEALKSVVTDAINQATKDATSALSKVREITRLKEEIEDLKIEKKGKEWEFEKQEMSLEHKVGLERKRQEVEIEQAKREALVSVREENLTADKARFEEQMSFIEERFTEEVKYLKEIMADVLKCLKKNGNGEDERNDDK